MEIPENELRGQIQAALQNIILEAEPDSFLEYAADYARHCFKMLNQECSNEDLHTQLLYVQSYTAYWRGKKAKLSKAVIKQAIQILRRSNLKPVGGRRYDR